MIWFSVNFLIPRIFFPQFTSFDQLFLILLLSKPIFLRHLPSSELRSEVRVYLVLVASILYYYCCILLCIYNYFIRLKSEWSKLFFSSRKSVTADIPYYWFIIVGYYYWLNIDGRSLLLDNHWRSMITIH